MHLQQHKEKVFWRPCLKLSRCRCCCRRWLGPKTHAHEFGIPACTWEIGSCSLPLLLAVDLWETCPARMSLAKIVSGTNQKRQARKKERKKEQECIPMYSFTVRLRVIYILSIYIYLPLFCVCCSSLLVCVCVCVHSLLLLLLLLLFSCGSSSSGALVMNLLQQTVACSLSHCSL